MKLTKITLSLLSAFALAYSASASATIVNIDATKYGYNSRAGATVGDVYSLTNYDPWGGDYTTLQITLAAGEYTWSNAAGLADATYNAYSYSVNLPSWTPAKWAWDFAAFDSATNKLVVTGGIANANRTTTSSAAQSLAAGLTGSFTLAQTTTLNFAVRDYFRSDNSGGVSLNVTAVPEPESYAMMLAGLGLVGFAARRKISA